MEKIHDHLTFLYGPERGRNCFTQLEQILDRFRQRNPIHPAPRRPFNQTDAILITYGDQIREPGRPPLQSLGEFLCQHVNGTISGVHILPFFPYSSDDGFSVIDYWQIDPTLGSWEDVRGLGAGFDLMFDAVVNHISAQSEWFQRFLAGDPEYADFFITVDPGTDLSQVTRPRALPLLSPVQTPSGEQWVWTTFSADQVDLNFANPAVMIRMIELLLHYVERGASLIRLDAIAYLWKRIGANCIHLDETHRAVQLFRAVLDQVAPDVKLITETNVPHQKNISYFGDGRNEAQMVYNFSLAPLLLNAIQTGRSNLLSHWAAGLELPSDQVTFFNFTASHDGIGVMPARGILSQAEIQALVDQVIAHGGFASHKTNPDGGQSVYELNISYFDALSNPHGNEDQAKQVSRFMLSQAVMLAMLGVPGIYVHSLLGSRSWPAGVQETGRRRTINRQKFQRKQLERELADPASIRRQVFAAYTHLLQQRASQRAFHPHGRQEILFCHDSIFALLRSSPAGREQALCLHNVSDQEQTCCLRLAGFQGPVQDLISGGRFPAAGQRTLELRPYQALWLIPIADTPNQQACCAPQRLAQPRPAIRHQLLPGNKYNPN